MTEAKTWKCPQCGKTITSLYDTQLEQNKKVHMAKHTGEIK